VNLLNDYELRTYNIRRYEESVRQAGLAYMQFPIVEMAPPDSLPATQALIRELHDLLTRGEVVALHCRGGVGRAGTVAACLYLHMGLCSGKKSAKDAIDLVRRRRCPQAVESRRQEQFIAMFAAACNESVNESAKTTAGVVSAM